MRKIVDYYILTSVPGEDITSRVINMIQEDWQPIGGMAYMEEGICVQTMVKYRDVIKPTGFGAVKDSGLFLSREKNSELIACELVKLRAIVERVEAQGKQDKANPTLKDYHRSMTIPGDEQELPSFGEAIAIAARELEAHQATVGIFRDLSDRFHQRYKSLSALKGKTGEAKASKRAWLDCKHAISRLKEKNE